MGNIALSTMGKLRSTMCALLAVSALASGASAESDVDKGRYLVNLGGCSECHTPGYFFGKPDEHRLLGGSDVGFFIPKVGTFVGPNLTPDVDTGLGTWSEDDIVKAISTGITPDGRELASMMPWRRFAKLQPADLHAIAVYLRSLPPVTNKVAGPFGPTEQVTVSVFKIVPPDASK
ncbi:c-type cytochrome [Oryzifoliimicrobium ureilyticus]|uniref:c-type cytochrome n=1 Tax=Oryzifoliimicrobium ureilyticus TaxID=3113724 RepID=UPI003F6617EE